jgi:hypothetical protein
MTDPFPFKLVDTETDPPYEVASYWRKAQAEFHRDHLRRHGGTYIRAKVDRGGYGINEPSK